MYSYRAVQGVALGFLPLILNNWDMEVHLVSFSVVIISIKGIAFPWMLNRTLRELATQREIEPFIGYGISIIAGTIALVTCMWLSSRLPFPEPLMSPLIVPVAFFTIMSGLFLIISRKKALTQVLGYLVLENGIYAFGVALVQTTAAACRAWDTAGYIRGGFCDGYRDFPHQSRIRPHRYRPAFEVEELML